MKLNLKAYCLGSVLAQNSFGIRQKEYEIHMLQS